MRHAKSDWDADYGSDHDRPLNARGARSAESMGRLLAKESLAPALVITSTAVRARTTAEIAAESGNWDCEIVLEPRLYGTGADAAVQVAAAAPDLDPIMLVGHQPTWSILASVLTGENVEMKTATVAVIEFDIDSWVDIVTRKGTVRIVLQPRDHLG